jgi:hypothetical protein
MDIKETGNGDTTKCPQTELEKLVEQKQLETDALKRLIDILKKNDLNIKDNAGPSNETPDKI